MKSMKPMNDDLESVLEGRIVPSNSKKVEASSLEGVNFTR